MAEEVVAGAIEAEQEKQVDREIQERRAQLALGFARIAAFGCTAAMVVGVIVGAVAQVPQLLLWCIAIGVLGAGGWLFPVVYRRGYIRVGIWALLLSCLVLVAASLLIVPDLVVPAIMGCALLIVMSNQLLGARESLWLIVVGVVIMTGGLLAKDLLGGAGPSFRMEPTAAMITNAVGFVVTSLTTTMIVRQIVAGQEGYFRQSRLASREMERHASAEQGQRELLQTVVETYAGYMVEVGRGNLAVRLPGIDSGQEAGDPLTALGRQLNEMVVSLQEMIVRIRDTAADLNQGTIEILAASTQQASGASEQSAAISQTTATVEELKALSVQVVERAQEVAGSSQRTVRVARSGRDSVEETIGSMAQIKARVEGIAENILMLSEQTQQISEIIETVNDIAVQSNMLALNASVEAVRAGEHGRGFAVVAEEVRNLAEQSRQATAQVRQILLDVQNSINATVMATEEGVKVVDEGVRLASGAGEAIEGLAGVIDESAQMAAQMTAGGRQQASGVEQIALAMQSIDQATLQGLASTRQVEKAAQNLNTLARRLNEVVEQYQL